MDTAKTMSRRGFVAASATGIAGAAAMGALAGAAGAEEAPQPAGAGQAASEGTPSWRDAPAEVDPGQIVASYDVEVGIVGLGHAGLAVLRAAAEQGATVLAVESQPENSWWTIGHDIGCINSQTGRDLGVPDVDVVEFINDWMLMANYKANASFVSYFAQHSGEAVDWYLEKADPALVSQMRAGFFPDNDRTLHDLSNGFHYYGGDLEIWTDIWEARANATPGEDINAGAINNTSGLELKDIDRSNLEYVQQSYPDTATTLFETKGCYLTKDGDRVSGFVAKGPDGYIQVSCSKGVVLAGGGFGGNPEMCQDLLPAVDAMYTPDEQMMCMFDRDGSTIQMGVWAGGHLEAEISSMNFDVTYCPDILAGPLWVDDSGRRFQNEASGGTEINGLYMARAKRGRQISVFDSTLETQLMSGLPCHSGLDWSNGWDVPNALAKFKGAEGKGAEGNLADGSGAGYFCADTLEELAGYLYPQDKAAQQTFLATVEEYNHICESGQDTDFGKDPHFLIPVQEPPFYAHANMGHPGFALATTGGFVTTDDQQVEDEYYKPIEGLYATGNTCGLRFGPTYITPIPGVSVGMCYTLGRKLGEYLAAKE